MPSNIYRRTGREGPDGDYVSFNLGARWARVVNPMPWRLWSQDGDPVPIHRSLDGPQSRSGWVRKISPSTGIRSSDRPECSESLYRLQL